MTNAAVVHPELARLRGVDRVTPERCAQVADAGEAAVQILERWGLRRARGSLGLAVQHLRQVAAVHSYGPTLGDWDRTATAVQLVADWYHIAASLPPEHASSVAGEIAQALRRDNGDIRSQLRLGFELVQAGLNARVPRGTGRRPDFLVTVAGQELAVEVKVAQTRAAVLRTVDRAAAQIRDAGHVGVVAIDVSPALAASHFTTGCYHDRVPPHDQFRPRFGHFARHVAERVAGQRGRGRYGVISGLVLYARIFAFQMSEALNLVGTDYTYAGPVLNLHPPEVQAASRHVCDALFASQKARSTRPPIRI